MYCNQVDRCELSQMAQAIKLRFKYSVDEITHKSTKKLSDFRSKITKKNSPSTVHINPFLYAHSDDYST